jgi:hypothetical protein
VRLRLKTYALGFCEVKLSEFCPRTLAKTIQNGATTPRARGDVSTQAAIAHESKRARVALEIALLTGEMDVLDISLFLRLCSYCPVAENTSS